MFELLTGLFSSARWRADALVFFAAALCLVLLALCAGLLFLYRKNVLQQEQALAQRHMQEGSLRARRQSLARLNELQDGLKQRLLTLQQELNVGRDAEALAYVSALTRQNTRLVVRYADNPVADIALLNAAALCKAQGLAFRVQGALPADCTLPQVELASLLYNILDNAIEAAAAAARPGTVTVRFSTVAGRLCIEVSNPASAAPHDHTTKREREYHGFGAKIIRHIVARYDGSYDMRYQNGVVTASVMVTLPLEKEVKDTAPLSC